MEFMSFSTVYVPALQGSSSDATSTLVCIIGLVVVAFIVFALVYLLKKTKEEDAQAKLELQQIVRSLPSQSQTAFMVHYNAHEKKASTAIILALLLGGFGAHKFYLGKTGQGILYLLFCWTGIPLIVAFIEAFTLSRTVIGMNRAVAREAATMFH